MEVKYILATKSSYSNAPWGRRRDPATGSYTGITPRFDRGYTMHEHYDGFTLINMNGRLYAPVIGRMLQPDIVIQDQYNSQAYNSYSYCLNNPLRYTDPSGYVVTVPPGFENYYFPNLLHDPDAYVLELANHGARNAKYDTRSTEGKNTITFDWNIGNDNYEMTVVNYNFPELAQMYPMGCVAACLAMHELRFNNSINPVYVLNMITTGNNIFKAIQNVLMDSQVGAYENGLRELRAMRFFASKSQNYSHTFGPYLNERKDFHNNKDTDFEEKAFNGMDKDNSAIMFSFYDDAFFSHMMNVSTGIKFQLNSNILGHELFLWDTDSFHNGGRVSFQTYSKKFEYRYGIIPSTIVR